MVKEMVSSFLVRSMVVTVLLMATPTWAQTVLVSQDGATATGETPLIDDTTEVRQLLFMEQAFEEAVKYGIRVVERQLPPFPAGLVFFAGPVQARGFRLEGYGVFFDVEFPVVRRSVLWSMRTLDQFDQFDGGMAAAMEDLRRRVLEESLGWETPATQPAVPVAPVALGSGPASSRPDAPRSAPVTPAPAVQIDPQAAYLTALTDALTDVLVTYGETVSLDGEEWLTVAARDGRGRIDPASITTGTVTLRIRGRDLAAVRDGRLSRQEARARVETP